MSGLFVSCNFCIIFAPPLRLDLVSVKHLRLAGSSVPKGVGASSILVPLLISSVVSPGCYNQSEDGPAGHQLSAVRAVARTGQSSRERETGVVRGIPALTYSRIFSKVQFGRFLFGE